MPTLADLRRNYFLKMLGLSSSTLTETDLQTMLYGSNVPEPAMLPMRSGLYYAPATQSLSSQAGLNGRLALTPMFIPNMVVINSFAFEVTAVAAPAGATFTPAVYADDGQGWPAALIGAGSPVDVATSTGAKEVAPTSNFTLNRGWCWVGGLILGATTTPPSLRMGVGDQINFPSLPGQIGTALSTNLSGTTTNGLSSLPANYNTTGTVPGTPSGSFMPRVFIKVV